MHDSLQTISSHEIGRETILLRRRWHITGRVQGVGFRPFVFRIARRLHLTGAVWNDAAGVVVEAQGSPRQLRDFVETLHSDVPAAASIRDLIEEDISIHPHDGSFEIRPSVPGTSPTAQITADLALCSDCAAEIRDPDNSRRFRYALTNCTNCGPRFSIVRAIPYDRPHTTMGSFPMCEACREEYENPGDRRFHAQPTACLRCGPQLELTDSRGQPMPGDPIDGAARRLAEGKIVAIKGIGGFHLAVRADDSNAVQRLRRLKHRPAKPFALMCGSLDVARRIVQLTPRGERLLTSSAAPIVLARRLDNPSVAPPVAPGSHWLGIMLAYTPLHQLIFRALEGSGIHLLVMTSGNDIDEPLVFDDEEAVSRLGGLCDAILRHNRPIQRSVDDSVVIDAADGPIFVRRSRGYAPEPITLANLNQVTPGLAVGAELKSTVATFHDGQVVLSQHLGNLTQTRTFQAFQHAIHDLCQLFAVKPQWIAHDLHPAYLSTHFARRLASQWQVPLIGVQHHHAHAAAVLAGHELESPALAVICDGTGYGDDGTIWGGELLVADRCSFRRLGRLRPLSLPGGDACAKQPWRSALGLLHAAFGTDFTELTICKTLANKPEAQFIARMLATGASCVSSSSMGRVFDGFAALLGLSRENRFDAEAPAALEAAASLADQSPQPVADLFKINTAGDLIEIDLSPLIRKITQAEIQPQSVPDLAMLFHRTLADAWAAAVARAMNQTGLSTIALSGGVFCNELFGSLLTQRLEQLGATVLRHRQIPPNDGGVAFGQAVVAAARVSQGLFYP